MGTIQFFDKATREEDTITSFQLTGCDSGSRTKNWADHPRAPYANARKPFASVSVVSSTVQVKTDRKLGAISHALSLPPLRFIRRFNERSLPRIALHR